MFIRREGTGTCSTRLRFIFFVRFSRATVDGVNAKTSEHWSMPNVCHRPPRTSILLFCNGITVTIRCAMSTLSTENWLPSLVYPFKSSSAVVVMFISFYTFFGFVYMIVLYVNRYRCSRVESIPGRHRVDRPPMMTVSCASSSSVVVAHSWPSLLTGQNDGDDLDNRLKR